MVRLAKGRNFTKSENGGWIVNENNLYPCRGIVINFKGTNFSSSLVYHLFETEVLDYNEETGLAQFRQTLPDTPPTEEIFNAWITQSINSASKAYFDRTYNEAFIASNLNSTYLCNNDFTDKLLKKNFEVKEDIPSYTATEVMNLDLPFLDNIDVKKLCESRVER